MLDLRQDRPRIPGRRATRDRAIDRALVVGLLAAMLFLLAGAVVLTWITLTGLLSWLGRLPQI